MFCACDKFAIYFALLRGSGREHVCFNVCAPVRKSWPITWRANKTNPNKGAAKAPQNIPKKNKKTAHGDKNRTRQLNDDKNRTRQLKRRDINQRKLPLRGKTMTNVYDNEPDHPLFDADTATHWIYPTSEIFERRQYQVFSRCYTSLRLFFLLLQAN